jgi:ubiquinone/menaquinone biosynthesis C-methylase UbiE
VLSRLDGIAADATILDVGCGTGRVTESLLVLVPAGRVLAIDASLDMVELARARLGDRAASILAAHLARLPKGRRDQFAADVVGGVRLPLDYVRLNVSAIRNPA